MVEKFVVGVMKTKGEKYRPRGRGTFSRQAKRAGFKSTYSFARHVLNNKEKYRKITIQRANLAMTLRRMRMRKKVLRKQ